ncbi:MAG: MucR family transcriptional regulator [Alphaproteobacteria bacterium]|nr:MucR family transcriptional regulator [Alphaproteobacteria bacterium]MBV9693760.1 MucR family transcriptional regulator [Alphaproteobacteria bacterium]
MDSGEGTLEMVAKVVAAYASNNPVPMAELPGLVKSVHGTLTGLLGSPPADAVTTQKPAVPIKKSVTAEHIVCLEDGKKLKMLKRYLRSRYQLSPEDYRAKWGLPADYPMVAPNYAAQRSAFAKKIGLGHRPAEPRRRKRG